jgi:hypothetical protein
VIELYVGAERALRCAFRAARQPVAREDRIGPAEHGDDGVVGEHASYEVVVPVDEPHRPVRSERQVHRPVQLRVAAIVAVAVEARHAADAGPRARVAGQLAALRLAVVATARRDHERE